MREALLGFIARLREAGVRISVAESLDAADAVAAAGLERIRLREALAATLVKDEADRPAFDREFDLYFRASHRSRTDPKRGQTWQGMVGAHGRPSDGGTIPPIRKPDPQPRSGQKSVQPASQSDTAEKSAARQPEGTRTKATPPTAKATARTSPVRTIRRAAPRQGIARRKPSHSASIPISIMSRR